MNEEEYVNCKGCDWYKEEEDICLAMDCYPGVDCTEPLPCEKEDRDDTSI